MIFVFIDPTDRNTYGGSFLYHLNDSTNVAVGFVIGLGMCENLRHKKRLKARITYFISSRLQ